MIIYIGEEQSLYINKCAGSNVRACVGTDEKNIKTWVIMMSIIMVRMLIALLVLIVNI